MADMGRRVVGTRNSGQLIEDVTNFAEDLNSANVAFAIVIGVPGVRSMRYWTNMSRYGRPGLEEFERQVRHMQNKVREQISRLGG
jgi:hypothetical protein